MTPEEARGKLSELMALPAETEWIEFKEAKNNFDFDDLGKYFSALSNEANLKGESAAWLVFGVTDKPPRNICGSNYRSGKAALEKLKVQVSQQTNHQITFTDICELIYPQGRVLLFRIPPSPRGIPTTWKGIAYGRVSERLSHLSLQEIEQIRRQVTSEDWSAQIIEAATIDDLDNSAIAFARQQYKEKHPHLTYEVDSWDDITFLNKAKVCIRGKITRAAIVLLGTETSEHLIHPAIARITWEFRDEKNVAKDYQHFGPPLILAVNHVFAKIRNLTHRYMSDNRLFPTETTQYDPWVIREALHNAIAHQDYTFGGRINVIEESASLLFTNRGEFIPGSVEEVIQSDFPPDIYRNRFLAEAMVNLNMIDTIGSGIKKMFTKQRERRFPMPDYDLKKPGLVKVRIIGKILDERYTRMLIARTDLDLMTVIALDKVQKGYEIDEDDFRSLKKRGLIEGRRPNLFVSARVAAVTDTKAEYIKKRGIEKKYCKRLVMDYLEKFREASRHDLDLLLMDKISDALNADQKKQFVTNLLQEMRREGLIEPSGTTRWAKWVKSKVGRKNSN